jgi:hypothetical protein
MQIVLLDKKKKFEFPPAPWLTAVILASQETELRRIEVRSQPGQIDTIPKNPTQKKIGLVEWLK